MCMRNNQRTSINYLPSIFNPTFRIACPCLRNPSGFLVHVCFSMTHTLLFNPYHTWLMSTPGPLPRQYSVPRMSLTCQNKSCHVEGHVQVLPIALGSLLKDQTKRGLCPLYSPNPLHLPFIPPPSDENNIRISYTGGLSAWGFHIQNFFFNGGIALVTNFYFAT